MTINIRVYGVPKPGGSKRPLGKNKKTGATIIVDACKDNIQWRDSVIYACREAYNKLSPEIKAALPVVKKPLELSMAFIMPRPGFHYNAKGQLKESAEYWHIKAPDRTKLTRSTEDAIKDSGFICKDDSYFCAGSIVKIYETKEQKPGAIIVIKLIHTNAR